MREAQVDLWAEPADAKCITTNGFIKNNGNLVMGAGVAGQAQTRWPELPRVWGEFYSNKKGYHRVGACTQDEPPDVFAGPDVGDFWLVSYPVKYNWYEEADLFLIERSAKQLVELIELTGWKRVLLPRPGCGNGRLKWEDVKPVIEPILDDRVTVIWSANNFGR